MAWGYDSHVDLQHPLTCIYCAGPVKAADGEWVCDSCGVFPHYGVPRTKGTELALPELIEIEPTETCNLRCIMCHVSYEKEYPRHMIDVDGVLKKLEPVRGAWVNVGSVYEPTLHPNIVDLLLGLSALDMKIDLITNGTILKEAQARSLRYASLANVTFSFDGIRKETFEGIRRRANFERTLEGIRRIKEGLSKNPPYFAVNYVIMKRNLDELTEAADFWDKEGMDHLAFVMMVVRDLNPELAAEDLREGLLDIAFEKVDAVARHVIENKRRITLRCPSYRKSPLRETFPGSFKGSLVRSENPDARLYFNSRVHYQRGEYPGMGVECRSPFKFARILWSGDVELCYRFVIGNIYQSSFKDIWYGAAAEKVRQKVMAEPKACRSCDYLRFCVKGEELDLKDDANYVNWAVREGRKKAPQKALQFETPPGTPGTPLS